MIGKHLLLYIVMYRIINNKYYYFVDFVNAYFYFLTLEYGTSGNFGVLRVPEFSHTLTCRLQGLVLVIG